MRVEIINDHDTPQVVHLGQVRFVIILPGERCVLPFTDEAPHISMYKAATVEIVGEVK